MTFFQTILCVCTYVWFSHKFSTLFWMHQCWLLWCVIVLSHLTYLIAIFFKCGIKKEVILPSNKNVMRHLTDLFWGNHRKSLWIVYLLPSHNCLQYILYYIQFLKFNVNKFTNIYVCEIKIIKIIRCMLNVKIVFKAKYTIFNS